MRKFGANKRNPNPPWPNSERSKPVVPPGSSAEAIGMSKQAVHEMTAEEMKQGGAIANSESATRVEESERELRRDPIMGNMPQRFVHGNMQRQNTFMHTTGSMMCGNMNVSGFLCSQKGKYVKLEFLFGENTHMEKIGRLREVGKDFVAIQENGTNNIVVCATNKIKFINIYEYNWQ